MTTASLNARSLPKPLRRGLGRVDRKIRGVALVRGLGLVAIVLAVAAAIGMALDFALPLPIAARWGLWCAWIGLGVIVFAASVLRPIARRSGFADLAAVAERSRPEMGERLTSTVELLTAKTAPHGSPALIAALADDAAQRAASVRLADAVSSRRALAMFTLASLLAAAVVMPSFVRPDPFLDLARRFLMPWAELSRPSRFVVSITPGDAVVAIGSDVPVIATITPRFGPMPAGESARLEWSGADGEWHGAAMVKGDADAGASFTLTLPSVSESLRYRVASDSADGATHRLTAVEPPSAAKVTTRVEPPAYTRIEPFDAKNTARVEAWEGSKLKVTLTANKPVESAQLNWPDAPDSAKAIAMTSSDGGTTWLADASADVSGDYRFTMVDEHKLTNRPEPARRLVVRHDAPPTIAVEGSPDPRDAQADDILVVEFSARDDLAVAKCDLLYAIAHAASVGAPETERGEVAARVEGLGKRSARGEASLSLRSLALKLGDVVTYQIRVADSRPEPKGPNIAYSAPRALRVVDKADSLLARDRSAERQSLQDQLNALKKLAAENRQGAETLRYAADAASRGNGKWDDDRQADLTRREAAAKTVVDGLNALARDFAESGQFAPLERPARQIADVEAEAGRETLDAARQAADAGKRMADLRTSDDRLAAVQTRLEELQRKFDELTRLDDDRRKLREMAERQDDLAKRADELAKSEDRSELENVQQEQERLRKELDEMARRSPELRAEALAARAREADDLARKTRELAERQREEARKTADPAGREARLKALAELQRKVEDDARRLALEVDRPLEENGRARLDAGALARAVEPLERGEIEPGRQRLGEAENAMRRLARDLDDVRDDPRAFARRLAKRQDVLNNQVNQAIREARDPEMRKTLPAQLAAFADRQRAIARAVASLPVLPEQQKARDEAELAAERPVRELRDRSVDQVPNSQNHARDRLNNLANALPDPNQARQRAMQAMREAKNRTGQVARELGQHLQQTTRRPDQKDFDPDAAARDLARRVAPLADRQAEAVRQLAEVDPDDDAAAQRDRALDRARDLADALDALREAAPPESKPDDAKHATGWRLLGPFDDPRKPPPFNIDRPIDLKTVFDGHKGAHPTWVPAEPGGDGRFDLGAKYSKADNVSAFAYVTIDSPSQGRGRLVVGSDDTMCIWLNGKRVYEFNNNRSWSPDQDRVDVDFLQGPNRLLVRCGNMNSDWAFSVKVQPPRSGELARKAEGFQKIRESLPAMKADATAALDRLEAAMNGREPDDDRAEALAEEMKTADADGLRAAATALRNLDAPDAAPQKAEAVRRSEQAAKARAENRPDADQSVRRAVQAVERLAHRMTDADTTRERAEGLADAQQGLTEPDAPRDPRAQSEVQTAIADQAAALASATDEADAARDATRRAAELASANVARPASAANPEPMAEARKHAAEALAALAKAEPVPPQVAEAPKAGSARDQVKALAARQRVLAKRAENLRDRSAATPKGDDDAQHRLSDDLTALARDQAEASDAAREVAVAHPSGSNPRREAEANRDQARSAEARAVGALAAREPARAAESANKAADALDRLAQNLPAKEQARPDMPPDPELRLNAEHAQEARALARRERDIRERVQALMVDRVEAQEALRDEAANLGRELAGLRDGTRDISPKSHGPANQAAELLQNQAPPVMTQGANQLAQGQADPARDTQRRAAEVLERAAQQAEDLANALRSDAPADALARAEAAQAAGHPGDAAPADLASAREAQREAASDLAQARNQAEGGEQAAQAASQAMRQAAQGLRAAAATHAPKGRTKPGETAERDPKDNEAGRDDPHLAELKESIKAKTGRNWGELPGHLRSEILQMSNGKYRDDYARLIGLYFKEIAAGRDGEDQR